jgi:nicotinamidase-related amidase
MSVALLLIDIQNDYFDGGALPLVGMDAAVDNAREILTVARNHGVVPIHIRHESKRAGAGFFLPGTDGAKIHDAVHPEPGEKVITKHFPNAFRETNLNEQLEIAGVDRLTVVGAMTHMCVDATVRAAFDFGYSVTVVADGCATRSLEFGGELVDASNVHRAFLAALQGVYAEMTDTERFISGYGA